jgi:hypothetical protein
MCSRLAWSAGVVLLVALLPACDRGGAGGASTSTPTAKPAPSAKPCASMSDCAAGDVCWFAAAGCGPDVRGTCGPQDPPCYVAYPFCGCTGHTYYGCSRPPAAWSTKGECGAADAGKADGGR